MTMIGADPNIVKPNDRRQPLHAAAAYGRGPEPVEILINVRRCIPLLSMFVFGVAIVGCAWIC